MSEELIENAAVHGVCPKCGKATERGYGLACGPGIGAYEYCTVCEWSQKWPDEDEVTCGGVR